MRSVMVSITDAWHRQAWPSAFLVLRPHLVALFTERVIKRGRDHHVPLMWLTLTFRGDKLDLLGILYVYIGFSSFA
jgi:hypothetical protein